MQSRLTFRSSARAAAPRGGARPCANAPAARRAQQQHARRAPVMRAHWLEEEEPEDPAVTEAFNNMYPNPDFIKRTQAAFPEEGLADMEQCRALLDGGWTYLDVRSDFELDESGKIKVAVHVPFAIIKRSFDPVTKDKIIDKKNNPNFIKQVAAKFPKKDAKIMVGCSNGKAYSVDALEALEEAGYENLVWIKGGYQAWFNTWDNKLKRRVFGEYAETYMHDGDSCGIHASGAGFEKVDKIERVRVPVY